MNRYRYEELSLDMVENFRVRITEEMMESFSHLSGDPNPLHTDDEFAGRYGFPQRVVYGMLTASFLSTLGGGYLPGERCLIQSVEVKFVHPVFVGDELEVRGVVDELNDCVRQAVLKVEIRNQRGEKVLRGKMKVGVLDEGA